MNGKENLHKIYYVTGNDHRKRIRSWGCEGVQKELISLVRYEGKKRLA